MFKTHAPRILVIDDDPEVCQLMHVLLRRIGVQSQSAATAERAEQLLRDLPSPDGIILDLMLPHRSGLEVLSWLRARPALRDIPVAVLTACTETSIQRQVMALGACAFLTKPSGVREIIGAVRAMLEARSA
jgi:CheY-like chemotaxis protein